MTTNEPNATPTPAATPAATPAPRKLWMKLFGLKRRPGKRVKWGLTRWGMFLALAFFMLGGMAGFAEYSMTPQFCQSCHIMEPYYQAWHQSTHKNVPCTDCHFLPGTGGMLYGKFQASSQAVKYITGTYGSKPHAEISDASCTRSIGSDGVTKCHDRRLLEGKVDWAIAKTESGHQVTIHFDHTPHLTLERRGKQLRCVSCHSQIVQGQHLVVTTDTCFLCHFKGLKHGRDDETIGTCRGCHDAPKQTITLKTGQFKHSDYTDPVPGVRKEGVKCENCHSDTVRGSGEVPRQVCWNCHNQPAQIERYGDTKAMHKAHVTEHKVECGSCHVQIQHSLVAGADEQHVAGARFATDSGTCGMCHEQTHNGPREMFQGTGGRGVPDMPSPMARARVNCIACHMTKENESMAADVKGQTFVASQERCDYCHGDKYKGTLADWKKTVDTKLAAAQGLLLETKKMSDAANLPGGPKLTGEQLRQVQIALDDAEFNLRFVSLAHGVHNPNYATALLSVATERCKTAQTILKGGIVTP